MTTITKERIELFIKNPLENGLTRGEQMELARSVLASLDTEPAGYHVIKECGKVGCSVATLEEAEKTRDFWNKKWTIRPYFYTVQPVQETGVYKDMLNIIDLLENNEWAEHCTSTVLGSLLESEITRLVGKEQPAPVVPVGLRMALSNAGIAAPESDEMLAATHEKYIQALVTWVKDRKPFQPASVVPEECPEEIRDLMASHSDALFNDDDVQEIWNACRAAMLQGFRDLSQPVDPQVTKYEQIMLRAGWVMVPVEPTDEMIAAAMECEDVLFNSDGSFCVQFREIYCAMLAAAPKPEGNNG
ncbi:TPA: hypothetical protein ACIBE2_000348 [Salmonella enterica subsp. diarizonae serovar 61:r:-]